MLSRGARVLSSTRMQSTQRIVYTLTDEAPALATYALLPVVRRFTAMAGVQVVTSDISLASRILSSFPERLSTDQRQADHLAELGHLVKEAHANIIKLPNISASVPQLHEAIAELKAKGYDVPAYPQEPKTEEEHDTKARYAKVLGSAVNPVLREGNSDRRVAPPVKEYARKTPHRMGAWASDSATHVASMTEGDFYSNEQSVVMDRPGTLSIELDGTTLKSFPVQQGEVVDSTYMSVSSLRAFLAQEMDSAKAQGVLLSLHLKATMMKVSDPIIFGHAVSVFFDSVFTKYEHHFQEVGVNPNNGFQAVLAKLQDLGADTRAQVEQDIAQCFEQRPDLAMVDSSRGITNLHVPSDVIIDASMPVVLRDSGRMWNKHNELQDTKCIIPDRCYAGIYSAAVEYCKAHGQFDVATMGSVANVGLMAQKAEEYGSHDKTFQVPHDGVMRVVDDHGTVLMSHEVRAGDVWRACQTKDAAIRDWVRLAVARARATDTPAVFWLDPARAHDLHLIHLVNGYLGDHDTQGLDVSIMAPVDAIRVTMARATAGQDTISVTGNVLRDYLTDLFPILELGTSAKMLSIVPLLAGGGLFETGAGGSAPKHVQQFLAEAHLRWDSLGEYLALAVSLEHLAEHSGNAKAKQLGLQLNNAIGKVLNDKRSPSRKAGEPGNQSTTFYLALYWAEAMALEDPGFAGLATQLKASEAVIVEELAQAEGKPVDIGGYYKVDQDKAARAMRPSATLNRIIDEYTIQSAL